MTDAARVEILRAALLTVLSASAARDREAVFALREVAKAAAAALVKVS